jgi:hypothetical protein
MKMVRKQVYITQEQEEKLKRAARDAGLAEADIVRRGIDLATGAPETERRQLALRRLLAFMEERAKLEVPQVPRRWTRDELYDDG